MSWGNILVVSSFAGLGILFALTIAVAYTANLKANILLKRVEWLETADEMWNNRFADLKGELEYQDQMRDDLATAHSELAKRVNSIPWN